jgi:glucose/arabinose dehydrogenase
VVTIGVLVGGNFAYTAVKEKPPMWLLKLVTASKPPPPLPSGEAAPLTVPPGFTPTIYSKDTPNARVITQDPKGALVVSLTGSGKVVALPDLNGDGKADRVITILENLKQPHGLSFVCPSTGNTSADQDSCKLYVAETNAVKEYAYDADTYTAKYEKTLLALPSGEGHFTRTLLLHSDGKRLLVAIGSDCNVCNETNPLRAAITAINLGTGASSLFASGLRNTVFMAINPVNGSIWGTENGRDLIGDDLPPDEVNILAEGKNYGWPICYGNKIHDIDFDNRQYIRDPCADTEPPHIALQAHSASLGLAFIPEEGWPEDMRNDLLVAYHGSWNRSTITGYKVVRFDLDKNGNAIGGPIDFVTGFLPPGGDKDSAIGRPVGLLALPGGTLYVSDDRAGAIYKISRTSMP